MNATIAAALAWISANQAILIPVVLLVVNDIRNGLTKHPAAAGFLGMFLDLISTHAHAESPSTFKLPGTLSKPPAVVGATVTTPAAPLPLTAIALLLLAGSLSACEHITGAMVATDVVNCGSAAIQANATADNVQATMAALMSGDPASVEPGLEKIGLATGAAALFCLVGQVVTQLESGAIVAPAGTGPDKVLLATMRGEQFLHGWHAESGSIVHRRVR